MATATPLTVTHTIYSATNSALVAVATTTPAVSQYGFTLAQGQAIITAINSIIDLINNAQLPNVKL